MAKGGISIQAKNMGKLFWESIIYIIFRSHGYGVGKGGGLERKRKTDITKFIKDG